MLRQIGANQLSPCAARRLAEFDRKFVGQTPEEPDGIRGGMVRSPIAGDRTRFMSDYAWLSAICKFSKPRDKMRSRDDGLIGGAMELSRELKGCAKEAPDRFIALLARFPDDAYEDFAWGITVGIAEAKPDSDTIERVLAIVDANPGAKPDNRSLIWMVRACTGQLGMRAETLLLALATGTDNSTGIGDIQHGESAKEPDWKRAFTLGGDLTGKAINSARGSALEMLGNMCWRSRESFEKYRPVIEPIIGAPAAAHVHSSLSGLLMSALKHEGKHGIDWVLRTAHACQEAFYTHDGQQIFSWVGDLDATSFERLINLYVDNSDSLARGIGSLAVFQHCLGDPEWRPRAEQLIDSSVHYRSAAAAVAAANFESVRFGTTCTKWLIRFFNDEDEIVRREASDCFRRMKTSNIAAHAGLFEAYAFSKYFQIDRTYFMHRLENAPRGLDDLVLTLLENSLASCTDVTSDPRPYELRHVGELLLKLYTSNRDHSLRRTRALDLIDRLVERGLMGMHKLEAV